MSKWSPHTGSSRFPVSSTPTSKTYLKLAMGAAPVLEMRAAGIPVGLASDGPVSNNTLDLEEIKARVRESMTRLSRRVPESRIQLYRP